jgi:hypothetical protein
MGTARDRAPHSTCPRGLACLKASRPCAHPCSFVATPVPPPRSGTPRAHDSHLRHDFHSALDRRLYSGLLQVPMRLRRIRLRCRVKTTVVSQRAVTTGLTDERGTAASAG